MVAPRSGSALVPSLTALTLVDAYADEPLLPESLADIAFDRVPALQYIGWVTGGSRSTFKIERKDGKFTAVEIEPFTKHLREDLWLSEGILDHFGNDAHEW